MRRSALLVLLFGLTGCGYLVDEAQACRTARTVANWRDCRVASRSVWWATFHGCRGHDVGFAVTGTSANNQAVDAVVCCDYVGSGCEMRGR